MALELLDTATAKLEEEEDDAAGLRRCRWLRSPPARRPIAPSSKWTATRSCATLQNEERRYQITKDLSDNLTISYSTSEVVMARLMQTTQAKERVYQQAISFFSTNETVFTALVGVVHGPVRPA